MLKYDEYIRINESKESLIAYHGTLLSNYNLMNSNIDLLFTLVYDDAVMYALMGGEARFNQKVKELKKSNDEHFWDLYNKSIYDKDIDSKIELLKYCFPENDKPIILKYNIDNELKQNLEETNSEYEFYLEVNKNKLKVLEIDFSEYYNVEPIFATFETYFD